MHKKIAQEACFSETFFRSKVWSCLSAINVGKWNDV